MENNRYQVIILGALCALVILSGEIHPSTMQERFEEFADNVSSVARQATNEIRGFFYQPEPFPIRLGNTVEHHVNIIYRELVDFSVFFEERLSDLIIERIDDTFNYIERQIYHFTR